MQNQITTIDGNKLVTTVQKKIRNLKKKLQKIDQIGKLIEEKKNLNDEQLQLYKKKSEVAKLLEEYENLKNSCETVSSAEPSPSPIESITPESLKRPDEELIELYFILLTHPYLIQPPFGTFLMQLTVRHQETKTNYVKRVTDLINEFKKEDSEFMPGVSHQSIKEFFSKIEIPPQIFPIMPNQQDLSSARSDLATWTESQDSRSLPSDKSEDQDYEGASTPVTEIIKEGAGQPAEVFAETIEEKEEEQIQVENSQPSEVINGEQTSVIAPEEGNKTWNTSFDQNNNTKGIRGGYNNYHNQVHRISFIVIVMKSN